MLSLKSSDTIIYECKMQHSYFFLKFYSIILLKINYRNKQLIMTKINNKQEASIILKEKYTNFRTP